MSTRFIQKHRIGEVIYMPGDGADHLPEKELEALLLGGIVARKAEAVLPRVAKARSKGRSLAEAVEPEELEGEDE